MYIFFDSKVTTLRGDPKLVSLGLISEFGCKFYAECDIDADEIDESIRPMLCKGLDYMDTGTFIGECTYSRDGFDYNDIATKGSTCDIVAMLRKWLNQFDEKITVVCDISAIKWKGFLNAINNDEDIMELMGTFPADLATVFMVAGYATNTNRLKYLGENGPMSYNAMTCAELTKDCFFNLMDEIEGNTPDTWKQCDKCDEMLR